MQISALELTYSVTGVGYLQETCFAEIRLDKILEGIRPLSADWGELLLSDGKAPQESLYRPLDFCGWLLGDDEKARQLVVYHSLDALAAAINDGQLRPTNGPEKLRNFGLLNSKGKSSASHLRKAKKALKGLGLHNTADISKSKAFQVERSGDKGLLLYQRMTRECWRGELLVVFVPRIVRLGNGAVVNSARWIARACQTTKWGADLRRPVIFYDGMRPIRLSDPSKLPDDVRADFQIDGEACVLDQSVLFPPLTFVAMAVIPSEAKFKAEAAEKDTEAHSNGKGTGSEWGGVMLPAFSCVRISDEFRELSGAEAAATVRSAIPYLSKEHRKALPYGYANCDMFLCRRRSFARSEEESHASPEQKRKTNPGCGP